MTCSIGRIGKAIEKISEARGLIGAQQNRLEHTYNNVNNIAENTQAAESVISDTNVSSSMVELSTHSIIERVGTAVMAQANQTNRGVFYLAKKIVNNLIDKYPRGVYHTIIRIPQGGIEEMSICQTVNVVQRIQRNPALAAVQVSIRREMKKNTRT